MNLSSNKVLYAIARLFQIIVGIVFIVASILKAFHPVGFAGQITDYHVLPASTSMYVAWFFIVAEFVLAVALIVNLKSKISIPLMMLVLLAFMSLTVYTMMKGINTNCGCFGNVVHRTPDQVILEDSLMFVALLFSFIIMRSDKQEKGFSGKLISVGLSFMLIVGITAFHNALPVDSIVTELKEGKQFASWPTENLFMDLNKEQRVVFLFSTSGAGIDKIIPTMNAIAQTEKMPSTIGLITDGTQQLSTLVFQYGVAFPVGALEPRFAKSLYRTLPRTFILDNGVVKKVWNGVPQPDEVKNTLVLMKK